MTTPGDGPESGLHDLEDRLAPGSAVEVLSRFNQVWVAGFEISAVTANGYWVRRTSDDTVLPAVLGDDDVRLGW